MQVGRLPAGPRDSIADVAGVHVGHCTLNAGAIQTGVTVLRVHGQSHYTAKVPAAATVLNGFGKSVGLMQVDELGVLETPIALTNTFSVSALAHAQIRQSIAAHPEIGRTWPTVNPLVFECNDGYLNDIQAFAVKPAHYLQAHNAASKDFALGAVGAGRGMSCFGLKGGIGSASRLVPGLRPQASVCPPDAAPAHAAVGYTVGALVLSNFGKAANLTVMGRRLAAADPQQAQAVSDPEKGSIIILLATDAPLDSRQLRRLSMRACAGLARTGSNFGHGSGDIALAFSTAYTLAHDDARTVAPIAMVHELAMDNLFEAAADSTEQAILSSLWWADRVTGRDGHVRHGLLDTYPDSFN